MEAAVAEKEEAGMTEGNDVRLDELGKSVGYLSGRVDEMSKRMDEGFAGLNRQFDKVDERFKQTDARFAQMDARFDALQRTLLQLSGVMFAGFLGLIATQI